MFCKLPHRWLGSNGNGDMGLNRRFHVLLSASRPNVTTAVGTKMPKADVKLREYFDTSIYSYCFN